MTPTEEKNAFWQGVLNACAVTVTLFFVVWVIMSPLRAPSCPSVADAPTPAPVETLDDRQERLTRELCDKEVEALLHSGDRTEVERAAAIIRQVNCGIEKRL